MAVPAPLKYPDELRERAIRLADRLDHWVARHQDASPNASRECLLGKTDPQRTERVSGLGPGLESPPSRTRPQRLPRTLQHRTTPPRPSAAIADSRPGAR